MRRSDWPNFAMSGVEYLLVVLVSLQPPSCRGQCSSRDDYSNKGLSPLSQPPYRDQQEVSYSCSPGRQTPDNSPTTSRCVNGR